MLNVTKTFLPEISEYISYLEKIWHNGQVTNEGPLVKELENKLIEFTGVKHAIYVTNGTIALQLAIKALEIKGKVITTPFSYCATLNSIIWEGCEPIFADINSKSLTCETSDISSKIDSETKAILTTHVYGNAGDLEAQEYLADEYNIPIIFDAAHCFGVNYKGKSIFNYGTVSTCSFHATKVFHTIEGGAIFTNDDKLAEKIRLLKSFGHKSDDYFLPGINGKTSEFHAAMGLVNLNHFNKIVEHRKLVFDWYQTELNNLPNLKLFKWNNNIEKNHSYFPVLFDTESNLLNVVKELNQKNIYPRRYFYPSLNLLPFVSRQNCKVSEDISKRILCLPLSSEITYEEVLEVCTILKTNLK